MFRLLEIHDLGSMGNNFCGRKILSDKSIFALIPRINIIARQRRKPFFAESRKENENNFIGTLIVPPAASAESYDIDTALLNLVMKEQFSGIPNEDVASHLNTFVELCGMQKKKRCGQ